MRTILGLILAILTFILLVWFVMLPIGRAIFPPKYIDVFETSNGNLVPVYRTWCETLQYVVWEIVATVLTLLIVATAATVYDKVAGED